jgi:tetratricopeptide (TPR) repeat protein
MTPTPALCARIGKRLAGGMIRASIDVYQFRVRFQDWGAALFPVISWTALILFVFTGARLSLSTSFQQYFTAPSGSCSPTDRVFGSPSALILRYIELKRYDDARSSIERYKLRCGPTALSYALEAELDFNEHKYDAAYRNAAESIRISPRDARMHELLGLILVVRHAYLNALPELETAAKQAPQNTEIQYFYGRDLYSTGHYHKALTRFLICSNLESKNVRVLENLGLCYEALQEFTKATEAYRRAIRIVSARPSLSDAEPYAFYGSLLVECKKNGEALAILKKALSIDSMSFRANYELGSIYLSEGDFHNAEQFLSSALNLDPQFAQTYYLMGRVYMKEHRFDDAKRFFAVFQRLNGSPASREFPFPKR